MSMSQSIIIKISVYNDFTDFNQKINLKNAQNSTFKEKKNYRNFIVVRFE